MRGEILYVGSCQSQLASARKPNTYSSGSQSRGNKLIPGRGFVRFVSERLTPLFYHTSLSSSTSGNLMLSPTFYTHTAHGCWDELNLRTKQHD